MCYEKWASRKRKHLRPVYLNHSFHCKFAIISNGNSNLKVELPTTLCMVHVICQYRDLARGGAPLFWCQPLEDNSLSLAPNERDNSMESDSERLSWIESLRNKQGSVMRKCPLSSGFHQLSMHTKPCNNDSGKGQPNKWRHREVCDAKNIICNRKSHACFAMIGENRQLVTDALVESEK